MGRLNPLHAAVGALVALVAATVVNVALTAAGGDTLQIPGELGYSQVAMFTLVMVIPAAIVLWLAPRWFPWIALAVAVTTVPFPIVEFGGAAGRWLAAMHLAAGVIAAVVAPRVAATMARR